MAMPPVASSMNPVRPLSRAPRSLVSTPATVTIDASGIPRASAIVVKDGEGEGVGVGVGTSVGDGVDCELADGVAVGSGLGSIDGVGSGVGVSTGVALGVTVGSGLGVPGGVGLGVAVAMGVGVGPVAGTAGDARFWAPGTLEMNQSVAVSFVSFVLPAAPPGRRSTLDDAGGAPTGDPSTKALGASPPPIASITDPPTTRSAIAPPVAAKPPVYVASPIPTYEPALFTTRIRRPGARIVDVLHVALRVTVDPLEVA